METLTMEHKYNNLIEYKHTPYPAVLKEDYEWFTPFLNDTECPYCRKINPIDMIDKDTIFIYVDPKGYLRFGESNGIGAIPIDYCPMCGRRL